MNGSINIEVLSVILLIAVGMYLSMALISFLNRRVEGASCYSMLLLAACVYSLGYYYELRSPDIITAFNWLRFEYFGIAAMPALWLLFTVKYSGYSSWIKAWVFALIWLIPIVTTISINTNDFHHLFYSKIGINFVDGLSFVSLQKGPFYWFHVMYYNISLFLGNVLILYSYMRSHDTLKSRFLLLFIGAMVPWVLIIVYILGGSPMNIDLAPFGFAVAGIIYIYNLFRFKTFDFLSEARLDVFTHLEESVLIFNSENELVDMNNSALQSYKIISSMKGMPIEKVCEAISIDKESKISDFTENVQGIYRTNNDDKWIDINSMAIKDENGLLKGRILIIKDITEDKKKQEEIEYLSFYDQLTGLYNRRFFEEELRRLDTPRNLPISIVIADLNGLKLANDAFGHVVGDKLLVKMAEILKKSCRSDDIIARMGGDEFVVILPKTNVNEVECVVNRISSAVNDIKIHSVMLSVAIGWEIKRHKDESMEEVLKKQRTLCIDVNCLTVLA